MLKHTGVSCLRLTPALKKSVSPMPIGQRTDLDALNLSSYGQCFKPSENIFNGIARVIAT